ncbi:unnamed protein product, partial [Closterium sp. Naga37s-1]
MCDQRLLQSSSKPATCDIKGCSANSTCDMTTRVPTCVCDSSFVLQSDGRTCV